MNKPNPPTPAVVLPKISDDAPAMTTETLAAVHALDLETLVPAARRWRSATRAHIRRLLRLMSPVLQALVAEVVILDRLLSEAEDELEQLRRRPTPTPAGPADPDDPHARLAAAHAVVGRLVPTLMPAPTKVVVETYRWEAGPEIEVTAFNDLGAVEAWAAALGAEVTQEAFSSGCTHMTATCVIDGIPTKLSTILLPVRAEVAA
ncbi:hypothetical protein ACFVZ3_22115 [Kitasatospora purpeofusca]|uniref:hypothetical protein n=1 Tax=Kitasatospora purpeofusca TaxID=67352 RepID=UPI0036BC22B5